MFPLNERAIERRNTFYLSVLRPCNGSPLTSQQKMMLQFVVQCFKVSLKKNKTKTKAKVKKNKTTIKNKQTKQNQKLLSRCNPLFQFLFKIKYAGNDPRELCRLLPFLSTNLSRKVSKVRSECRA